MALNFRLAYNSGYDYIDLMPNTSIEQIQGIGNILKYSTMDIEIPAFTGLTQEIPISMTEKQKVAPLSMELLDENVESLASYFTFDQAETQADKLVITRLGKGSETPINVRLRFWEGGV